MRKALPIQHQALKRAQVATEAVAVSIYVCAARSVLSRSSVSLSLHSTALGGLFF